MDAPHHATAHLPGGQLRPTGPRAGARPIPATAGPSSPATGVVPGRRLHGRRGECEMLDRLVADVRAGQSRVLVLRGEPGAGKTALLDYLAQRAAGCRVARVTGVEPEMEMAFAGLHQLCAPFLDRLGHLPGPQRDALRHRVQPAGRERPGPLRGRHGHLEPAVGPRPGTTAALRGGRRAVAGPGLGAGAGVRRPAPGGRAGRGDLRGAPAGRRARAWPGCRSSSSAGWPTPTRGRCSTRC